MTTLECADSQRALDDSLRSPGASWNISQAAPKFTKFKDKQVFPGIQEEARDVLSAM